jgi:hypothetical protein
MLENGLCGKNPVCTSSEKSSFLVELKGVIL